MLSWVLLGLSPACRGPGSGRADGTASPIKDYIAQGNEFTVCVLLLTGYAVMAWQEERVQSAVLSLLLAMVFLINIVFVTGSRTALVTLPVLLLIIRLQEG